MFKHARPWHARLTSFRRTGPPLVAPDTFGEPVATSLARGDRSIKAKGVEINPNRHVAILEEDLAIRSLLERWLGEAGYEVVRAPAGINPALVIADLPDPASAEAFVASVREYAAPILLISARFRRGLADSAAAARRLGVEKVLPKPFTRDEFLSALREALDRSP